MIQDIDELDTTQRYPIGLGLKRGGMIFHYAKAGGTLVPGLGAKIKNPQDISQEIIGAVASAGDRSIVLTLDNTDGPTYNGLLPQDYLKNGYVVVFAAGGTFVRQILSNTAVTQNLGTATFTVTLNAPIPCDLAITDVAEAIASPYACVVPSTATILADNLTCSIGVPYLAAVSGQYVWLQTWGPCWVAPQAEVGVGVQDKAAYFVGDGSFGEGDQTPAPAAAKNGLICQLGGFVLANDKGGGQGAPFVMLMLDPTWDISG